MGHDDSQNRVRGLRQKLLLVLGAGLMLAAFLVWFLSSDAAVKSTAQMVGFFLTIGLCVVVARESRKSRKWLAVGSARGIIDNF